MTCNDVFRSLVPFKGYERCGTECGMSYISERLCQCPRLITGSGNGRLFSTVNALKALEGVDGDCGAAIGRLDRHHELTGMLACHHPPRLASDIHCVVGLPGNNAPFAQRLVYEINGGR